VSNTGKDTNSANDGMTNQKISLDKAVMASTSLLSKYIKIKAMIEINGNEAMKAPKVELLLAISDIMVINTADVIIFIR